MHLESIHYNSNESTMNNIVFDITMSFLGLHYTLEYKYTVHSVQEGMKMLRKVFRVPSNELLLRGYFGEDRYVLVEFSTDGVEDSIVDIGSADTTIWLSDIYLSDSYKEYIEWLESESN